MLGNRSRIGAGLLLVVALSACGQQDSGANNGGTAGMASTMPMASAMEHGSAAPMGSMADMEHGAMASTTSSAPYDAQFIDSMIAHHTGAITMARDALAQTQRPPIKQLAEAIIRDQQREVEQMQGWRQQWYPDLEPTSGMGMGMGDMSVGGDASQPYDQRFIAAMIAHHNGAIAMARDALNKAEHPELKQLAEQIIKAQEAEISQLQQWQKEWFGA